jgi:hypothetical protein
MICATGKNTDEFASVALSSTFFTSLRLLFTFATMPSPSFFPPFAVNFFLLKAVVGPPPFFFDDDDLVDSLFGGSEIAHRVVSVAENIFSTVQICTLAVESAFALFRLPPGCKLCFFVLREGCDGKNLCRMGNTSAVSSQRERKQSETFSNSHTKTSPKKKCPRKSRTKRSRVHTKKKKSASSPRFPFPSSEREGRCADFEVEKRGSEIFSQRNNSEESPPSFQVFKETSLWL